MKLLDCPGIIFARDETDVAVVRYMSVTQPLRGRNGRSTRPTWPRCAAVTCPFHGRCVAVTRLLCGRYTAVARPLYHDRCVAVA